MSMTRIFVLCMMCIAPLLNTGCDSAPQSSSEIIQSDPILSALSKVGQLYHNHHDAHAVGPASWDDLKTMAGDKQEDLDAIQLLQDKGYDFVWGKKFSEITNGLTNTVMAQSSQESAKLMFDGSVSKN